jgi:hypothetical protein
MDWYEEIEDVKRLKVEIQGITSLGFETDKGWVKKNYCIYTYPPYLGQRIWAKESKLLNFKKK